MAGSNYTSIPANPEECTIDICPASLSPFDYRPQVAPNLILLSLFAASLLANLVQGIRYKTWTFLAGMVLGNITEVLGYVGRLMGNNNPFNDNAFLMQICCLTIAPAFFAAGIYLCLKRIVIIFGANISRIPPDWYTRIFIFCDFISLVLQAAGGGIASSSDTKKTTDMGNNIMVAGLAFQVFSLALFMALALEYAWRVKTTDQPLEKAHSRLRQSKRFKGFLIVMAGATTAIQVRSIYRLLEMGQGWDGELKKNETLFFVLEGIMVVVAVIALNVFHPGMCMRESFHVGRSSGEKSGKSSDSVELGESESIRSQ